MDHFVSAEDLAGAVREREISPVQVAEETIARIDELDAGLHAFCTRSDEVMLEQARALEERIARGEDPGPLAGVPVAVKDLIFTRGIRTTGGSRAYEDLVPDEDDVVVERVIAAGGLIAGKTNVFELGYGGGGQNPIFPATRNPWNTSRTPGGSSSGSGVAVATHMTPVALGSDGGGSVRGPASFCGIVGVKASMGRVPLYPGCRDPRYPGFWGWETIEHIGPMADSVRDAAFLLSVIAGPDSRDRHSIPSADIDWLEVVSEEADISGLRIGFSEDFGFAAVEKSVRDVVRGAAATLEGLGCHVEPVELPWAEEARDVQQAIVAHDTDLVGMRAIVAKYGDEISPRIRAIVEREWTAEDFQAALAGRQRVVNEMWKLMDTWDVLLSPVQPAPAHPVELGGPATINGQPVDSAARPPFTSIANLTGQPAASIPGGFTPDGLPVGVQFIGPHLGDAVVLRVGAAFEAEAKVARWKDKFGHGEALPG